MTNEQLFEEVERFERENPDFIETWILAEEIARASVPPPEPEIWTTTGEDLPPGSGWHWIPAPPHPKPGDVIRFSPSPLHVACGIAGEWIVQEKAPGP